MAIDVTIETAIDAPPDAVFARIADVDGWPSWLIASGIVSVARTGSGPLATGERLTVTQRAAGRAGVFDAVVEALGPPNRLVVEGRDAEGVTIAIEADVAAAEGGHSTLRWSIRIGLPFRYRIFESMAKPQVQHAAELDIEALRRSLGSASTG
jgi:uncharacterized protein YndB with AHSA1/START domain